MREIKWLSSSQDFALVFLDAGYFPVIWPVHSKCQVKTSYLCSVSPWLFTVRHLRSLGVTGNQVLQLLLCIHDWQVTLGDQQLMCSQKKWKLSWPVIGDRDLISRYCLDVKMLRFGGGRGNGGCCCYTELNTSTFFLSSLFLFTFLIFKHFL